VIGATLVLADGTVARTGGHVIKNVAGFDLAKLVHGAYGTLAVVAEVVLRLHPRPSATATLAVPCTAEEALAHAQRVLDSRLEPAALEWMSPPGVLLLRAEGTEAALPARVERLREVLGPGTVDGDGPGGGDAWAEHSRVTRGTVDDTVLRLGVRPSRLPQVLHAIPARAVTAGLGTGVATVVLPPDPDVVAAHAAVHAAGGTSVLRSRPVGATAPAWGPPPSALAVLQAVKKTFDPTGRLGPGRFSPWL
jgi:glycolate oxidase FAD binding subunit